VNATPLMSGGLMRSVCRPSMVAIYDFDGTTVNGIARRRTVSATG
jgi:hypothetical protein